MTVATDTIVVGGSLARRFGRGGHAWVFLQYLLGFQRLGYDVVFIDRLDGETVVDETGVERAVLEHARWCYESLAQCGLADSFALRLDGGRTTMGLSERELRERARDALVIDVMGHLGDDPVVDRAGRRVFLDLDPGFTQLWDELGLSSLDREYDAYVTVGTAMGQPGCQVPTLGLNWITTLPPVVLDQWPIGEGDPARITTVGAWRGLNEPIEWAGRKYGLRAHAFRPFATLPGAGTWQSELALDIHPADHADLALLRSGGWEILDPLVVTGTVDDYRHFVTRSGAELCVAKELYLALRTGWFSDRSACYLAAGRPVIASDTGVNGLPIGEGLLTFDDLAAAIGAVHDVQSDVARHRKAAREIAEAHLDSDVVLTRLLRAVAP